MWTIKEAADRAGLSPDVLRAWERRYGVLRPERTASGYRLYSEADIILLRAMQRLIDEGYKPREAADHLARNPRAAADTAFGTNGATGAARAEGAAAALSRPEATTVPPQARLIAAAADLDVAALRAYFDALGVHGSFEAVCEAQLFPAFRALGAAWASGTVSVAGEHAASAAAMRWLGAHYRAAARDARPPEVLVALPPGAHHELGALAHAVALRRNGLDVLYLGPDLPVEDLVAAVRTTRARAVVIGAILASDAAAAERVAIAIEEAVGDVRLAFGGPQAAALAAHGVVLPVGLNASVAAVARLLAG
ncbi:MAG TPA: MerR family transcriptional regulator [Trueperaceae bacterium]|nr:MerR family transcriptional regulator [Trueperaceae bacterium]